MIEYIPILGRRESKYIAFCNLNILDGIQRIRTIISYSRMYLHCSFFPASLYIFSLLLFYFLCLFPPIFSLSFILTNTCNYYRLGNMTTLREFNNEQVRQGCCSYRIYSLLRGIKKRTCIIQAMIGAWRVL